MNRTLISALTTAVSNAVPVTRRGKRATVRAKQTANRGWKRKPILLETDPIVRFILEHPMNRTRLAADAGVGFDTVRFWATRYSNPKIGTVRKVLRALGYDLTIVPLNGRPKDDAHT